MRPDNSPGVTLLAILAILSASICGSPASAGTFQQGDVISYPQAGWGDDVTPAGALLTAHFDSVYFSAGGVLTVGGALTMTFISASDIFNYMPASGTPGPLNSNMINPLSTASGQFGGEVTVLKLNVDFSDAGHTLGSLGVPYGDLVIQNYGPLPQANGLSIRQLLQTSNTLLGGGTVAGFSIAQVNSLLLQLNVCFEAGTPNQFAQDHLRLPGPPPPPPPATISINPKATYLHVSNQDPAANAIAIDLAALGFAPGDRVKLHRLGLYDNGPHTEIFGSMIGVFSATSTLLPAANLHRVPGAIDAGIDFVTSCTNIGCEPTDIPQDFMISASNSSFTSVCLEIPAGAAFLFVGPHDSHYSDNTDPNNDYKLRISATGCYGDIASPANNAVDVSDLLAVINAWGACPDPLNCPADIAPSCGDGSVGVSDLLAVINAWGACE